MTEPKIALVWLVTWIVAALVGGGLYLVPSSASSPKDSPMLSSLKGTNQVYERYQFFSSWPMHISSGSESSRFSICSIVSLSIYFLVKLNNLIPTLFLLWPRISSFKLSSDWYSSSIEAQVLSICISYLRVLLSIARTYFFWTDSLLAIKSD